MQPLAVLRPVLAPCLAAGLLLLPLPVAPPAHAGTTTILECRFDGEPLDTLIGQGGPTAGQPVARGGAPAYVRAAPFATPSLEIGDDSSTTAESVRFNFLNDVTLSTGIVVISANLYFHVVDGYIIYVREGGFGASQTFLNLLFGSGGNVYYGDFDSPGNTAIGVYTTGTTLPLTITFDLDAGTYDVELNGVMLLTAESLGVPSQGLGSFLIGADFDGDFDGLVSIDDVVVTATDAPTAVESDSWGNIKAGWRAE